MTAEVFWSGQLAGRPGGCSIPSARRMTAAGQVVACMMKGAEITGGLTKSY
jgi:hypothetical protein